MKPPTLSVAVGIALAMALASWEVRGCIVEHERQSALLSYRNELVAAEIARVETELRRSPPRTVADVTKIVGNAPTACDDKNEPGPLDDPRTEPCPKGTACHEAFYRADWYVRRRIERPDARVWFDRRLDGDNSWGKLEIRVAGCDAGDLVLAIDGLDPPQFALGVW